MTLDQTAQAVIDQLETWFPPVQACGAGEARAALKAAPFVPGPPVDQVVDRAMPGPAGDISIQPTAAQASDHAADVLRRALATEAMVPPTAAPIDGDASRGSSPGSS
jgi:hypothetical protein